MNNKIRYFSRQIKNCSNETSTLKGGKGHTQNYRAIPLLSVFAKILEVFLNNRLTAFIKQSNSVKRHNMVSDSENQM